MCTSSVPRIRWDVHRLFGRISRGPNCLVDSLSDHRTQKLDREISISEQYKTYRTSKGLQANRIIFGSDVPHYENNQTHTGGNMRRVSVIQTIWSIWVVQPSKPWPLTINDCSQVFHITNVVICWSDRWANLGEDFFPQTSNDRWVSGKNIDRECYCRCGLRKPRM